MYPFSMLYFWGKVKIKETERVALEGQKKITNPQYPPFSQVNQEWIALFQNAYFEGI